MNAPQRLQRRRTPGWKAPEGAVNVARPSRWGNPFAIRKTAGLWAVIDTQDRLKGLTESTSRFPSEREAREYATELFAIHTGPMGTYEYDEDTLTRLRKELGGRALMCWCPLPEPGQPDACHGAILLDIANSS